MSASCLNACRSFRQFRFELPRKPDSNYLFHLFGGKRVFAAVVAPPTGPDCVGGVAAAAAASVVVLLVARLVDGLVVEGKLLGTVPPAAVQLQSNQAPWKRPQKLIR